MAKEQILKAPQYVPSFSSSFNERAWDNDTSDRKRIATEIGRRKPYESIADYKKRVGIITEDK